MTTYLKYKPGWLQLLIFGSLTLGIFITVGYIGLIAISKIHGIPLQDMVAAKFDTPAAIQAARFAQAISSIALFALPALVFGYLSHQKPLAYLGFKKPQPVTMWLVCVALLLAAWPVVGWISELNQHMHLPQSMAATEKIMRDAEAEANKALRQMLQMRSTNELLLMIFIVGILPAFCEELFFRGVLQRIFINIAKRPWLGIVITAIIFSAIHGQFLGFFPRFILGALLGVMYWYSGSLWPGILAHFINNALQVIMVYKNPEYIEKDMQFPVMLIAISISATLALLWWIYKNSQTRFAEVYDTDDDINFDVPNNQL